MTPIMITLSLLIPSQLGRKKSGTDLGTGYGLWFSYPTFPSMAIKSATIKFYPGK